MTHAGSLQHAAERYWREHLPVRACDDRKTISRAVRCEDQKENVVLAIQIFCRRFQGGVERFSRRPAALSGVVFDSDGIASEAVRDDLGRAGRLIPKNVLISEETEGDHGQLASRVGFLRSGDKRRKYKY